MAIISDEHSESLLVLDLLASPRRVRVLQGSRADWSFRDGFSVGALRLWTVGFKVSGFQKLQGFVLLLWILGMGVSMLGFKVFGEGPGSPQTPKIARDDQAIHSSQRLASAI